MNQRRQMMKRAGQVSSMFLACFMFLCGCSVSAADDSVVAIVEPRIGASGLSYSVSIRGERFESTKSVLDSLGDANTAKLMLLVREDTPLASVIEIVSMGLKSGYERDSIYLFSFDAERRGVVAIPGYRYAEFSENPAVLSKLVAGYGDRD